MERYFSDRTSETHAYASVAPPPRSAGPPDRLPGLRPNTLDDFVLDSQNQPGFYQRAVLAAYTFPPDDFDSVPRSFAGSSRSTLSMAVSTASRSTYAGSGYAPSLVESRSSYYSRSDSSAHTSDASGFLLRTQKYLPEDDEVPDVPAVATRRCAYPFLGQLVTSGRMRSSLDCDFKSNDFGNWYTHNQAHFQGKLPKRLRCPMRGCAFEVGANTGEEAWEEQGRHLVHGHDPADEVDSERKPDKALVEHLWRVGLIDGAQRQELESDGRTSGQVFLMSARDDRRARRPRGSGRP